MQASVVSVPLPALQLVLHNCALGSNATHTHTQGNKSAANPTLEWPLFFSRDADGYGCSRGNVWGVCCGAMQINVCGGTLLCSRASTRFQQQVTKQDESKPTQQGLVWQLLKTCDAMSAPTWQPAMGDNHPPAPSHKRMVHTSSKHD